ncbi:CBS domain-containing protein [Raineyella fluvialis]|uniref:CBS domain-containing protein n=1 Tax=Raineyella fluvialis TaxID=2662261 RepID=A0A5Q2FBR8_9ACTN|nr:CBS domain-containing protein [Raineyella fluvialis]QGF24188.1 CBS domain-containing protein [Raineyella fluvialis]
MRISDILQRKGSAVVTLPLDSTIADAVALMRDRGIGCVVVTGPDSPALGIIAERDIVRSVGQQPLDTPVSSIMQQDPLTCDLHTDVEQLAGRMTDQRVRHVPVVEGGRLRGLVSIGDVVKAHLDDLRSERDHLVAYVQS